MGSVTIILSIFALCQPLSKYHNTKKWKKVRLYTTKDGQSKIEVRLADDTVWLTADQMAELFQRDRSTIQRHIKRIYGDGELKQEATCAFFAQVQNEGLRHVERQVSIYNLDMIISVGYRVNSYRGVQFRQW